MNNLEELIIEKIAPQVARTINIADLKGATEFLGKIIRKNTPSLKIKINGLKEVITLDCVHHKFKEVMQHVQSREPVFLTGPAGSGKSMLAEQIADALKLDFSAISVCAQTTKSDFLGYCDAHGNYVPTLFRRIYENGGIFLIDEIDAGNPNVLAVLNAALSNSSFSFPDKTIKKNENFLLIATANTVGKGSTEYIGRNQLDAATLDRFNFIYIDYDEKMERVLVDGKHSQAINTIHQIRKIVLDKNIKIIVSTRSLIKVTKLLELGIEFKDAIRSTIFKCSEDNVIKDILNKVKETDNGISLYTPC